MKLSDKLIELRKTKGWSQEDFAEKVDVSRQAISRWENGTALPDAQNILRISKLFGVSADFLLNDECEGESDIASVEEGGEEVKPLLAKKKRTYWYPILSVCLIVALAAFAIFQVATREEHYHPELVLVKENSVAPTCTEAGSYEEVIYCAECGNELYRARRIEGAPYHQFENEKCVICGKEQRER